MVGKFRFSARACCGEELRRRPPCPSRTVLEIRPDASPTLSCGQSARCLTWNGASRFGCPNARHFFSAWQHEGLACDHERWHAADAAQRLYYIRLVIPSQSERAASNSGSLGWSSSRCCCRMIHSVFGMVATTAPAALLAVFAREGCRGSHGRCRCLRLAAAANTLQQRPRLQLVQSVHAY